MKKIAWIAALVLFLGQVSPSYAPEQPSKVVVFYGVGVNYKAEDDDDDFAPEVVAVNDAFYYRRALVSDLISRLDLGKKATHDRIIEGLKWAAEQSKYADLVVVQITAHGHDANGYLFAPADFDPSTLKNIVTGAEIIAALKDIKCTLVVILDTCHSGALVRDWKSGENVFIITSARADEFSHGKLFFYSMQDALSASGDLNHDGIVSIDEVAERAPIKLAEILIEANRRSEYQRIQHITISKQALKVPLLKAA